MKTMIRARTKIICTIGPASNSIERLEQLIRAGMDVARLNFSHGTHDDHAAAMANIRTAAGRTGVPVTIVQDLQGPKIRIGELALPSVELRHGGRFSITTRPVAGDAQRVSTSYAGLVKDVRPGELILVDDGKIRLRVLSINGPEVECEVLVGGTLSAHKGINLPGSAVSAPSLTEKDLQDLDFGVRNAVDYVALSFVRSADDIRKLKSSIAGSLDKGRSLPVIAKIEKPQAVSGIDAIVSAADVVMVARGDLGVELPPEEVPVLQKMIIRKCNAAGKTVIVATQMLESMVERPTPTRAEASDVANAVLDGADAVMLSAETSVGKYPVEAVEIMGRIIRKAEGGDGPRPRAFDGPHAAVQNRHDALGRSACVLAEQMKAAAIVAVTHTGRTARILSQYRPDIPIIAVTDRIETLLRLNIVWGVRGMLMEELGGDSDAALQRIQERLIGADIVHRGDYVVLLAGQPFFARGSTNFIKVEQIT